MRIRPLYLISLGLVLLAAFPALGAAQATPVATPAANDYAHPEWLVEAGWLVRHREDAGVVVVGLTPAEEFAAGHIPGAAQIDWPALEVIDTSDASLERWRGTVEEQLTALGISRESSVIVYDGGTLFAARLWWILHYLDHPDVRILNGGLPAWEQAGGEVATGAAAPEPAAAPYTGEPQPALLAQVSEVEAALDQPEVTIIDARTPEEYGDGHIPGARNLNFPRNALPEPPRRFKPAAELRAMYANFGADPKEMVIPYCTTGVRSAVTFFSLALIGYEEVALFTGSWAEWSADPARPVAP